MIGDDYSPYEQWTRTPVTHLEYWGMGPSVGDIYYRSIVVSKYWDKAHLGNSSDEEELFFYDCIGSGNTGHKCYHYMFTVPSNLPIGYQNRVEEE